MKNTFSLFCESIRADDGDVGMDLTGILYGGGDSELFSGHSHILAASDGRGVENVPIWDVEDTGLEA